MKKYYLISALVLLTFAARTQDQPGIHLPPDAYNQKCKVIQWIGPVEIAITYHSPDIHGRSGKEDRKGNIWGKVVKYGFEEKSFVHGKGIPWRAGANENTTISFSHDVKIQGKPIKAGTYGLFLAAAKEGPWTWVFSNATTAWGSYYYEESEDVLRAEANSQDAPYTEWLTYGFDDRQESSAVAYLQWDEKRIPFKIEVENLSSLYVDMIKKDLLAYPGFKAENFIAAANFCSNNKVSLEQGLQWADRAIAFREDFTTLQTKAKVLIAMGKTQEATALVDRGLSLPTTSVKQIDNFGKGLLFMGEKDKAMEVFKLNSKKYPNEKFIISSGLARGYTAMGDKTNAIKSWEVAIKNLPEDQEENRAAYQDEIQKLKEKS